jgi:bifunctional non-homologous end joining protein LigD
MKTLNRPFVKSLKKKNDNSEEIAFGKINVKISNRDKLFWPTEGITKGDVIDYYISIADYILPYLKGRPESLKRNPDGILKSGFFHKDAAGDAPDWVDHISIFSESVNKEIDYIICNNIATLVYLANLGCIELNPWHSIFKNLDKPDYMIIDIDPSDKNTFDQVVETALVFKKLFDKSGAESYCKTSGATGMHIYVPLKKKYSYEQAKDFAYLVCVLAQAQLPTFTSLERRLAKRNKNHIYLDYLQNRRGQTIAAPYCLRPRAGATVSMPLKWSEVKKGISPYDYTIHNALKRLKKTGDVFSGVFGKGINMEKCIKNLNK